MSSLVDGRRSSPSPRGCSNTFPTLPRPSLYSGRRGSRVFCLVSMKIGSSARRRVQGLITDLTASRGRYVSHVDHDPLPAIILALLHRRCANWKRWRARRVVCIGRGHVVRPSNRRHHRIVIGVEARISSLVDDRRSAPSTRGCTGRCPTLPRPSLSSGRRGGLVYCPHFLKIILRRSPSRGRSALSVLRLGRAPPRYRVPGYYGAHVLNATP